MNQATEITEMQLEELLSNFPPEQQELIPVLQAVQAQLGYLPEPAMKRVAEYLRVPESAVYGVATFYAQFRFQPRGRKHIMVCRGTSCYVQGATEILRAIQQHLGIEEGQTTPDFEYSLETVACIGACGLAPCIMIDQAVAGKLTPEKIREILGRGGR